MVASLSERMSGGGVVVGCGVGVVMVRGVMMGRKVGVFVFFLFLVMAQ